LIEDGLQWHLLIRESARDSGNVVGHAGWRI